MKKRKKDSQRAFEELGIWLTGGFKTEFITENKTLGLSQLIEIKLEK